MTIDGEEVSDYEAILSLCNDLDVCADSVEAGAGFSLSKLTELDILPEAVRGLLRMILGQGKQIRRATNAILDVCDKHSKELEK